jgi:ABC-type transporter Mla MlaB component
VTAASLRASVAERPLYQWDPARETGARTLRLYGSLGEREFVRVLDALAERARAPRDVIAVDFMGVEHVDFRAVAEFLTTLARWRDRGASIWLVGTSAYVRLLMDVSGQGALRRSLSWDAGSAGPASQSEGENLRSAERRALRAGVWK